MKKTKQKKKDKESKDDHKEDSDDSQKAKSQVKKTTPRGSPEASLHKLESDLKLGEDAHQCHQDENIKDYLNNEDEKFQNILNRGENGSVIVEGIHKSSQRQVAIKIIKKCRLSLSEVENIRDTIHMYQVAQHYYVVRLEDYFETRDKFYICLEMQSQFTLYQYIRLNIDEITENLAQKHS